MKKIMSWRLVCALSAVLFAGGCTRSREEAQDETAGQEAEGTPLEVWICYDRNVPGAYYVFQWDTLAETYGYEIEVETYSEQELRDKLKMAVVCNELPDIFYVPGGNYPEYLFEAGACMPVQEELQDAGFQDRYLTPSEDGNNYIIPCVPDSYAVAYYDAELMEEIGLEIPETMEELEEMIRKVDQYNRTHGTDYAAIELGMKDKWMGELFGCMIACLTDPEGYRGTLDGNASAGGMKALGTETSAKLRELITAGAFPENYMETGEPEAVRNFINHDAVMMVHQSSLVYHLIQNMGEDGFAAAAFPGYGADAAGGYHLMDMNGNYKPGLAVNARSEYREDAAALCVEFALEVNRINAQEHGYLNITDTEIAAEGSASPQVQFLHEMEARAGGRDAFLFSALDQETGDAWGNTVKQFFAGELSEQEFSENTAEIMENYNR